MSAPQPGDRVGAFMFVREGVVYFLGYGTYEGDEVPPPEVYNGQMKLPNPKIKLDAGDIVWGCECWWAAEARVMALLAKSLGVKDVSIHDYRKEDNQDDSQEEGAS